MAKRIENVLERSKIKAKNPRQVFALKAARDSCDWCRGKKEKGLSKG